MAGAWDQFELVAPAQAAPAQAGAWDQFELVAPAQAAEPPQAAPERPPPFTAETIQAMEPQGVAFMRSVFDAAQEEGEAPAFPPMPGEAGYDAQKFPAQFATWRKAIEPAAQAYRARRREEVAQEAYERQQRYKAFKAKMEKLRPVAKVFAGSPALGVAERAAAQKIPPEERSAFLEVLREEYAATRAQEKAGFGARLGTSVVQGAIDFGMPLAELVSDIGVGPLEDLDSDQERFRQQMVALREQEDPTIREDTPWLGRTVQKTGRMTVPMAQSIGLGKSLGGLAKGLGAAERGTRIAESVGVSGSFLPQIADSTYRSLVAEGVEPGRARIITAVSAPIEAAVESILPDPFKGYGSGLKSTIRQAAAKNVKQFAINYGKELAEEGLQGVINETAMEVGRQLDEDIPNQGLGNILVRGVEAMGEAAGPLGLMMAPGGMAGMVAKVEEQGGTPSRADAKALGIPEEQAMDAAGRKAWFEKHKDKLGGGGPQQGVREEGGGAPEGGQGVQPGGRGDRGPGGKAAEEEARPEEAKPKLQDAVPPGVEPPSPAAALEQARVEAISREMNALATELRQITELDAPTKEQQARAEQIIARLEHLKALQPRLGPSPEELMAASEAALGGLGETPVGPEAAKRNVHVLVRNELEDLLANGFENRKRDGPKQPTGMRKEFDAWIAGPVKQEVFQALREKGVPEGMIGAAWDDFAVPFTRGLTRPAEPSKRLPSPEPAPGQEPPPGRPEAAPEAPQPEVAPEPAPVPETPPAAPGAAAGAGGKKLGTKNEAVYAQRAARGLPPIAKPPGETVAQWDADARAKAAADPTWLPGLVVELNKDARPISKVEEAGLGLLMVQVHGQQKAAADALVAAHNSGDVAAQATAGAEVARHSAYLEQIEKPLDVVGTEWAHWGVMRQQMRAEDDSLAGVIRRATKAKGPTPLTTEEYARFAQMAEDLAKAKTELEESNARNAQLEVERQIAEVAAKRRETLKERYRQAAKTATEYGLDFDELEARAKERAKVEAEAAREYNAAYKAVVEATGLTPAKIRDIEEGRFLEGGKPVELSEYGGLDEKAPMLAREYPALAVQSTPGDAMQTGTEAAEIVERLKDGPKRPPDWHDKLDEVAVEMAAEKGQALPDDFTLEREPATVGSTEFDPDSWETETEEAPKKSLAKKPRMSAKEKAAKARARVTQAVANLKESLFALKPPRFATFAESYEPGKSAEALETFLHDLREVGLAYIELGVRSFNAAVARLTADLGHMSEALRRNFEGEWRKLLGEGVVPSPVRDPSDMNELGRYARKLTRWVVESGVEEREAVVDEVHRELETVRPGITRRETMDAMSGYGDFKELTKDEVSRKVRAIQGELQQIAKLEDMAAGQPPSKTGFERREPSDEERRLIQQVNEAKKRGGFEVTDPDRQLRSAQQSAETALVNWLKDRYREIESREKIVRERHPVDETERLAALREERDRVQAIYEKVFPREKKPKTDEQRNAAVERGLDWAITKLEAELGEGKIGRKPPLARRTSPTIEAKRAHLEALRAQREAMRAASPAYQAAEAARWLAARKKALTQQKADLEDRLARKDFRKKTLRRSPEDAETLRLEHEVSLARKKLRAEEEKIARANRPTWKKALGVPVEIARTVKTIWASFDFSALGRQGGWLAAAHPVKAARAQLKSFKAATSDKEAFALMEEIAERPNAKSGLYQRAGLELTDITGPVVMREEMFQSTWAEHIPIVKHGIKASERAYVAQLNQQRADVFDAMVATLSRTGEVTEAEAKIIANYINVASWRGDVSRYEQLASGLGAILWTPRGYVSRFQLLLGQPFMKGAGTGSWRVRRLIAKEYARSLTGLGVFYATAGAFLYAMLGPPSDDEYDGWAISPDLYSSDVGKIRIRHTRLDPLGGLSQATRITTRLSANTVNGLRQLMGGDLSKEQRREMKETMPIIGRFLKTKLAPAVSLGGEVLTGEDYERRRLTAGGLAVKSITPLNFRDVYEAMREHGMPEGSALSLLATFGLGLQYQEPKKPKKSLLPKRYQR